MKLLFVNACIRGKEISSTYRLCREFIDRLGIDCEEIELAKAGILPLNAERLSFRDKLIEKRDFKNSFFDMANSFAKADIIVIGAPFWDFSFPSLLKVYTENICINGITFEYTENGVPYGLCRAKKLVYISTAGGFMQNEGGLEYFKELNALFGIKDLYGISAQGLDIYGADREKIIHKALERCDELADKIK